jgi:hypothetical protein
MSTAESRPVVFVLRKERADHVDNMEGPFVLQIFKYCRKVPDGNVSAVDGTEVPRDLQCTRGLSIVSRRKDMCSAAMTLCQRRGAFPQD